MSELDDRELLRQYAQSGSADAFGELVRRHVDLVYSSALRRVGDPHLADDVTQATFLLLSQRARRLGANVVLTGWLFNTARYAARTALRSRARRERHEREAAAMRSETSAAADAPGGADWQDISTHLDAAMDRLRESDRQLVLLSYFEKRSHEEVARSLGISVSAATKRLSRAVERLRKLLARRETRLHSAGTLVAALTAHAVQRAPRDVVAHAVSPSASAIAKGAATMMLLTKIKWASLVCLSALLAGAVAAATADRWVPQALRGAGVPKNNSGYAIVAKWEIAVPPTLADAVRRIGKPIATESKSYDAYLCDRAALSSMLQAAQRDKTILAWSWPLQFAEPRQMQGWPDGMSFSLSGMKTLNPGPKWVPFFLTVNGTFKLESRRNAVRLTVTTTEASARLRDVRLAGSMQFAGDLPLDKTLVFVGHVGAENGVDVSVIAGWQPVPCTPQQSAYVQRVTTVSDWLNQGGDAVVTRAEEAVAWNQSSHGPDVPQPRWTRTLDNGVTIKLVAVSSTRAPDFAWWDADGAAVALGPEWKRGGESASVVLDITDPSRKGRGRGMNGSINDMEYQDLGEVVRAKLDVSSPQKFTIGVAGGDGTVIGTLRTGGTLDAGGIHFEIHEVKPAGPRMGTLPGAAWVEVSRTEAADVDVILAAVDATGAEHWDHLPDVRAVKPSGEVVETTLTVPLAADEIDHFVVRTRQRAWTTFDSVSGKPGIMASQPPIPPATTTPAKGKPEAMMNELADAIEAGDLPAARRHFDFGEDPAAQSYVDAMIRDTIAAAQLRRAIAERFGEAELNRLTAAATVALADPRTMRRRRFTVSGDSASEVAGPNERIVAPPIRRVGGEWKWVMLIPPATDRVAMTAGIEEQNKHAAALTGVAQAIREGKYPDADAMADDLRRRLTAPAPATTPAR